MIDDKKIRVKCINEGCPICGQIFELSRNQELTCGFCKSELVPIVEKNWLEEIAENEKWVENAEENWPQVIAFEYKRLKKLCAEANAFGVLLCLKDNYEVLLKFELLVAFAWSSMNMDERFEEETISLITTSNLSLGAWLYLANVLKEALQDRKSVV